MKRYYEVDTNHAPIIPETATDKLYNSIVRIENLGKIGTGFFMKINIKNSIKYFLITCYHVINQDDVNAKITIEFYYGKKKDEKKKTLKLDNAKRFIGCYGGDKDSTVIEILKSDEIPEDKYLIADLNYKYGYEDYKNKKCFLAGYPNNPLYQKERHATSKKIGRFNEITFEHTIDTTFGCSGAPVCLLENVRVVGIHRFGIQEKLMNYGNFIGIIIDEIEKEYNEKKIVKKNINIDYYYKEFEKIKKNINELKIDYKGKPEINKKIMKENKRTIIKLNKHIVNFDDFTYGEYFSFYKKIIYYYYNQNEKNFIIAKNGFNDYLSKNKDNIKYINSIPIILELLSNVDKNCQEIIDVYNGPSTCHFFFSYVLSGNNTILLEKFSYFIAGFLRSLDIAGKPIINKCLLFNEDDSFSINELNLFKENIGNIISFKKFFYSLPYKINNENSVKDRNSSTYKVLFTIDYEYNRKFEYDCYDISKLVTFPTKSLVLFRIFTFFKIINVSIDENNKKADIRLKSIGRKKKFEEKIYNLNNQNKIVYNNKKERIEINENYS